jgi:hypothetical protein
VETIALHYPSAYQPPVGAWWWNDSDQAMESEYLPGNEGLQVLGNGIMGPVSSRAQFEYCADRMAGRLPDADAWGVGEIDPGSSSPQELLKMMGRSSAA